MLTGFIGFIIALIMLYGGYKLFAHFNLITDILGGCAIAVGVILLIFFGFVCPIAAYDDEQQNIESTIEKNYKNCAFIEKNQFYSDGKLYQYRLDNSKSKVIIICKDDGTKEVDCFKLDK